MPIKYMGGKGKYASKFLEIILRGNEQRVYVEPFVGSAAMLVAVPSNMVRLANDKNPYLVAMHEAVRDGWIPPSDVTEDEYRAMRNNPEGYPKHLVGFVSIAASFGGVLWGSFARGTTPKGVARNYVEESKKNLLSTVDHLQGVVFTSVDYKDLVIPDGAVVYCDPPYSGTSGYGDYNVQAGDFWRWCNKLVARGCQVFVSGYKENKAVGWEVAWSEEVKTTVSSSKGKLANWRNTRIECLFRPMQKHVDHLKAGLVCGCWKTAEDLEREERLAA